MRKLPKEELWRRFEDEVMATINELCEHGIDKFSAREAIIEKAREWAEGE